MTPPEPEPAERVRPHVLVVDDNDQNLVVAKAICKIHGCTVETATDGLEAVALARSGRFDLVLMDVHMPRMDGVEAASAIRALPGAAGRVPILAVTANTDPAATRTYRDAGMQGVVGKPISLAAMVAAMRAALVDEPAQAAETPLTAPVAVSA